MGRRWLLGALAILAFLVLNGVGCSKNPTRVIDDVGAPETELTYAPLQADTAFFRVHLYWYGFDTNGEVIGFRFAVDSDTAKPFVRWRYTTSHDSEFTFAVAPGDRVGAHVFWVTAQDNEGRLDPTPAKRYFSIHTQPPVSSITSGPLDGAVTGPSVTFGWTGTDPDGGPTGNPVRADSFEYLLLLPGTSSDGSHTPLPRFPQLQAYVDLINQASGASLPPPYDDWKWTGTSAPSHRFTGLVPGFYIITVRAVDAAGAHDSASLRSRNIRYFYVSADPERRSPPLLTVTGDLLTDPLCSYAPVAGAYIPISARIPILEGDAASFSWTGAPGASGSPIAGFTSAIDDTSTEAWSHPDPTNRSLTLPANLRPGTHVLYVRAVDESGTSTTAFLTLEVAHATFRDPGQAPSILYVDDFAAPPGDWNSAVRGSPNFPTDPVEDDWWTRTILSRLAGEFGMTFEQWDPVLEGTISYEGRLPPVLQQLAIHRVVIWSVDLTNTISSHVAFWEAIASRDASELRAYVRGGGTLIVTGFGLAGNASRYADTPFLSSGGMCATLDPGSISWRGAYFVRDFMGITSAKASDLGSRHFGAKDFVEARVTPAGAALGFDTATLDVGGSGAKWDSMAFNPTIFPDTRDTRLAPGLPKVEGWTLEDALGCSADESRYRRENPSLPIASPILTYHGVNQGVLEDQGPSPREGLVVGIATQAHDNGTGDGSIITSGSARGVVGRMVFLGFPVYYLKDEQAYQVMRAAFTYVNGSPTLPAGAQ